MPRKTAAQDNLHPSQGDPLLSPPEEETPPVQTTEQQSTIQLHRYAQRLEMLRDIHSAILTAQSPQLVA